MAQTLVDSMSEDFDPDQYTDEYQIELKKLLDEAIESGSDRVTRHEEAEPAQMDAEVVDLVAALQRSLEATGRGGESGKSSRGPASKSASKSAAKATAKATTKRAASKSTGTKSASKSTAKKAAPKATKQTRKGA